MGHWYNYRAIPMVMDFLTIDALNDYTAFQCGM